MASTPAKKNLTESEKLRLEMEHLRYAVRNDTRFRRSMALAFLKGTVSALGAIAAVVIVMPVVVWVLQSVHWPPLIADIVSKVILQIEQSNRP